MVDPNDQRFNAYNDFGQFSNFKTFMNSQYLMMQILTEGSWVMQVWSYCYRQQNLYGWIVALFIFMHLLIVTVMANLLKGIFWEIYFTVSTIIDELDDHERVQKEEEQEKIKSRD